MDFDICSDYLVDLYCFAIVYDIAICIDPLQSRNQAIWLLMFCPSVPELIDLGLIICLHYWWWILIIFKYIIDISCYYYPNWYCLEFGFLLICPCARLFIRLSIAHMKNWSSNQKLARGTNNTPYFYYYWIYWYYWTFSVCITSFRLLSGLLCLILMRSYLIPFWSIKPTKRALFWRYSNPPDSSLSYTNRKMPSQHHFEDIMDRYVAH